MAVKAVTVSAERRDRRPPVLLLSTLIPISVMMIVHPLLPLFVPAQLTAKLPLPPQPALPALQASIGFALIAFVGAILIVPRVADAFITKGLKGRDLLKPGGGTAGPWM